MRALLATLLILAAACSTSTKGAADAPGDPGPGDVPATDAPTDTSIDTLPDAPTSDVPDAPEVPSPPAFQEFPWTIVPATVQGFLCDEAADPLKAPDKTTIHCRMEGADFTKGGMAGPKDSLVIWAYNLAEGPQLAGILERFKEIQAGTAPEPLPDLILASELDRGFERTGRKNVARDLAEALGMYYVFAVEFVELANDAGAGTQTALCEHGDAMLSRYPLGNVQSMRFARQLSWYRAPDFPNPDQPRLGGRTSVIADVKVGDAAVLHAVSVHLESGGDGTERTAQAAEAATAARAQALPSVIGGDMNTGLYFADVQGQSETPLDPTVPELTSRGFIDAHASLPGDQRVTSPGDGFVLDLIFGHDVTFSYPGIGSVDRWATLSDHLPVWATATP